MMNRTMSSIVMLISVLVIAFGFVFLCASTKEPFRIVLALGLLVAGFGLAAWSGVNLKKLSELDPEHLSDRITTLAKQGGHAEITLSQVVAELGVPDEVAAKALDLLVAKHQATRETSASGEIFTFPGLVERKLVRKCPYCGHEFSVKTPVHECPHCGGKVEVVRQ